MASGELQAKRMRSLGLSPMAPERAAALLPSLVASSAAQIGVLALEPAAPPLDDRPFAAELYASAPRDRARASVT